MLIWLGMFLLWCLVGVVAGQRGLTMVAFLAGLNAGMCLAVLVAMFKTRNKGGGAEERE